MSEVYYKLYKSSRHGMTIVCMQDFDECDYHQDRFVRDSNDLNIETQHQTI